MPENRIETSPASVSSLVGGIINDAQQLIRQELMLARRELQEEVNKAKTAALSLAVGGVVALLGVILLCVGVADLIGLAIGYRFAGFLIVGGVLGAVGVALLLVARNKASSINLVPPQTAETMRENVQWLKNQT